MKYERRISLDKRKSYMRKTSKCSEVTWNRALKRKNTLKRSSDSFHGCMGRKLLQFPTSSVFWRPQALQLLRSSTRRSFVFLSPSTRLLREVPELLINAWYLDDGTLCGSLRGIGSALAIIESVGPSRGLVLNKIKSLL